MDRPSRFLDKNDRTLPPRTPSFFGKWLSRILFFVMGGLIAAGWVSSNSSLDISRIFKKSPSPSERYRHSLVQSGLAGYGLGEKWMKAGREALQDSLSIELPFQAKGYFSGQEPDAITYTFPARDGEVLDIDVQVQGIDPLHIFIDLFRLPNRASKAPWYVAYADSGKTRLEYRVKRDRRYMVRIQPELFRSGSYHIKIMKKPAFAFPVEGKNSRAIKSFFGAPRGGGTRKHKGVDIFAAKGTPALSAINGRVTRVKTGGLGGKVVWLRDDVTGAHLYYAHLDSQIARRGQRVRIGQVVGLVGKTGNARTTPPHLHFGVYKPNEGAVDPYPYIHLPPVELPRIRPGKKAPGSWYRVKVRAATLFSSTDKKRNSIQQLARHAPVRVLDIHKNWCRIESAAGLQGFVRENQLEPISKPIKTLRAGARTSLLEKPLRQAPVMEVVPKGKEISALAMTKRYYLVENKGGTRGWIRKGI